MRSSPSAKVHSTLTAGEGGRDLRTSSSSSEQEGSLGTRTAASQRGTQREDPSVICTGGFTPDQEACIRRNRRAAQLRLLVRFADWVPMNFLPGWALALAPEFGKRYFSELQMFIQREQFNFDKVKVVILGKEPACNISDNGIAFSQRENMLHCMYMEVLYTVPGFPFNYSRHLTSWARQGMLLLNEVLTVHKGAPGSNRGRRWEIYGRGCRLFEPRAGRAHPHAVGSPGHSFVRLPKPNSQLLPRGPFHQLPDPSLLAGQPSQF
uniref:Uncharacterized protein n=1 Tax=Anolis carolinensis TaxID=28377 RepID=A0A803T4E0_ANOCA